MTTPKPASAPQADAIYAKVAGYELGRDQAASFVESCGYPVIAQSLRLNWHTDLPPKCAKCNGHGYGFAYERIAIDDAIEHQVDCDACDGSGLTLAASAQVREVEPMSLDASLTQAIVDCMPAAEPAPVAQVRPWFIDEDGDDTRGHAYAFMGDTHVVSVARAQAEIDRLQATIASLEDTNELLCDLRADAQRYAEAADERATALEASLAACRADAELGAWCRAAMQSSGPIKTISGKDVFSVVLPPVERDAGLDAAIDALRQEAPHAE